jgi:hypothetical protein
MLEQYGLLAAEIIGVLTIVATVVARFIPSESFKKNEKSVSSFLWKLISYFPTLGKNPRTKKLEEAYQELQKEVKK